MASHWISRSVDEIKGQSKQSLAIGPFGSRMKSDNYVDKGIPVIRGQNITSGRQFEGDFVYITENKADELRSCNVFKGDLVFPHRGAIGEVGIVLDDNRYVISTSLMKLTCNPELAHPLFVYYFFKSPQGRFELLKNASQVGTPGIGQPLTSLASIQIPLPEIGLQKTIAAILGTLDDKIELNRRMNQTLEAMAQAIFQSWFVDFDPVKAKMAAIASCRDTERAAMAALAGKLVVPKDWTEISDKDLNAAEAALAQLSEKQLIHLAQTAALFPSALVDSTSEVGLIPAGWEIRSLDKIATYMNGLALQNFPVADGEEGLSVIKIAEMRSGFTAKSAQATRNLKEEYIIQNGDILFSWSGSLLVKQWHLGEGALNQHLFKVTSIRYPKWFYYFATLHHLPWFRSIAEGKATTMGHIQRHHLTQAQVAVYDDVVSSANQLIQPILDKALQVMVEVNTLIQLRDTLLPKLLSGELALLEVEEMLR